MPKLSTTAGVYAMEYSQQADMFLSREYIASRAIVLKKLKYQMLYFN
jgi:hypothetical protein